MPKPSHINRGSYYAEINQHGWPGKPPSDPGLYRPNVAMGVGPTPLQAAMDGYSKIIKGDPLVAACLLECEMQFLGETFRAVRKLEETLDGLTEVLTVDLPRKLRMLDREAHEDDDL